MRCPICKAETNDQTKFCTKCGKKIPRCPTCGKVVETRSRFCVSDGTRLPAEVLELLPETDASKVTPVPPKPKEAIKREPSDGRDDGPLVPPVVKRPAPKSPDQPPVRKAPEPRRAKFCTQCGGPCEEGQTVCAKCRSDKKPVPPVPPQPPRRAYCIRCGKPCAEGKNLCVECRSKDRSSGRYEEQKKGSGTAIVVGVVVLVLMLLIGVALFFIFREPGDSGDKQTEPESTRSYWDADDSFLDEEEKDFISIATEPAPIEVVTEPIETETEPIVETTAPTEPPVDVNSVEYRVEYFINNCSSEYFSESYFEGFDAEDCRLVRNAIYAHSGRKFNDASLQAYYEQYDWYEPRVDPANFSGSMLNDYQLSNVNVILNFEAAHGFN